MAKMGFFGRAQWLLGNGTMATTHLLAQQQKEQKDKPSDDWRKGWEAGWTAGWKAGQEAALK